MEREKDKKPCTAVVLAAGSGSRMKADRAKQYLLLEGKPLIWYALEAVEQSKIIDDCILVTGAGELEYVRKEIVEKYGFCKVQQVIAGGAQRWESVCCAMEFLEKSRSRLEGYFFIHDGARPFLTEKILESTYRAVQEYHACVAAVPSKDTIKLADAQGFAKETPDRRFVWSIQTPQVFDAKLIVNAYKMMKKSAAQLEAKGIAVTDDASVVELFTDTKVRLAQGSYENIKITTPEDMRIAKALLEK